MKDFFASLSVLIAFIGFAPYISDVIKRKTKPHALSWLVWSILGVIGFSIQITHNAGPGAWLFGVSTLITSAIFILSLKYGERNILIVDWLSFLLAGLALFLWLIVKRPLASVILLAFTDAIGGFFPTFRKSITKPHEETLALYYLYAVSLACSLVALRSFSLVNALYPASFVVINIFMTSFLIIQRRKLSNRQ